MKKVIKTILSFSMVLCSLHVSTFFVKAGEAFDVTNAQELKDALSYEGNVEINVMNDIVQTLPNDYTWEYNFEDQKVWCYVGSGEKELNLNGYEINIDDQSVRLLNNQLTAANYVQKAALLVLQQDASLEINDTGNGLISMTTEMYNNDNEYVLGPEVLWAQRNIIIVDGGKLTVNGGEIHAGRSKDSWVNMIDQYYYGLNAQGFKDGTPILKKGALGEHRRYSGNTTKFTSGNAISVYGGKIEINGGTFYGRGYDKVSMNVVYPDPSSNATEISFDLEPCAAFKVYSYYKTDIDINAGEFNGRSDAYSVDIKGYANIKSAVFNTSTNDYLLFPSKNIGGLFGDSNLSAVEGKRGEATFEVEASKTFTRDVTKDTTKYQISAPKVTYTGALKRASTTIEDSINYVKNTVMTIKYKDLDYYYDEDLPFVSYKYYFNLFEANGEDLGTSLTGWVESDLGYVVDLLTLTKKCEVGKSYYLSARCVQEYHSTQDYTAVHELEKPIKIQVYDTYKVNEIELYVDQPYADLTPSQEIIEFNSSNYSVESFYWYDETYQKKLESDDVFEYKHDYTLYATIKAGYGCKLATSVNAEVNDEKALVDWIDNENPETKVIVQYTFEDCPRLIDAVEITGLNEPKEYTSPDFYAVCGSSDYGIKSNIPIKWYDLTSERYLTSEDLFIENHEYKVIIPVFAASYRHFNWYDPGFPITLNGNEVGSMNIIDSYSSLEAFEIVEYYTCYDEVIDEVSLEIQEPQGGMLPILDGYFTTSGYKQKAIYYYDNTINDYHDSNKPLIAGHEYRLMVEVEAEKNKEFYISKYNGILASGRINGNDATLDQVGFNDPKKHLKLAKTFTCQESLLSFIQIDDIDLPMPNNKADFDATVNNDGIEIASLKWYDGTKELTNNDLFKKNKEYRLEIKLTSKYKDGYRQAKFDTQQLYASVDQGLIKVSDIKVEGEQNATITCNILCKNSTKLQGYVYSEYSEKAPITIQFIPENTNEVAYEQIVYGNKAHYQFDDIVYGNYVCRVSKSGHQVNEFKWKVVDMEETVDIYLQANEMPFEDVKTKDWFYTSVKEAYQLGLMGKLKEEKGIQYFGPDVNISRGMVATVLHRMENNPKVEFKPIFTDVTSANLWYSNAITWAASKQIVSGYKDGRFGPDDNIIRQDLAIMLRNYAKSKGLNVDKVATLTNFKDEHSLDGYAYSAIAWCVENKIMSGSTQKDGVYLRPKKNATRAECAKMFSILAKLVANKK